MECRLPGTDAVSCTCRTVSIPRVAEVASDCAERHFAAALRIANDMGGVAGQADIRLSHARMLLERNSKGDAERARTMLEEALPMFEESGRTRWVRECQELLDT
jgi:hypothetical protein